MIWFRFRLFLFNVSTDKSIALMTLMRGNAALIIGGRPDDDIASAIVDGIEWKYVRQIFVHFSSWINIFTSNVPWFVAKTKIYFMSFTISSQNHKEFFFVEKLTCVSIELPDVEHAGRGLAPLHPSPTSSSTGAWITEINVFNRTHSTPAPGLRGHIWIFDWWKTCFSRESCKCHCLPGVQDFNFHFFGRDFAIFDTVCC